MKTNKLTIKQEAFCQAYVRLGDKSAAYRESYSSGNMKPESINRKAFELFNEVKITARIEVLKKELQERNEVTIDELVKELANMVRFDPAEMYTETGSLKNIHDMPKPVRQMILSLDTEELFDGLGKDREKIGYTKKIRLMPKLDAIEKLMKYLGAYEKDNVQKAPSMFDLSGLDDEEIRRFFELSLKLKPIDTK